MYSQVKEGFMPRLRNVCPGEGRIYAQFKEGFMHRLRKELFTGKGSCQGFIHAQFPDQIIIFSSLG